MQELENHIQAILERNKRVEAEKAWETSFTRRGIITLITFVTAGLFLWLIENPHYLLNALVPAGAYVLSTLSIPMMKTIWMKKMNLANAD